MSEHFDLVCQHGYKHGTCRCNAPNKSVRLMTCNNIMHAEEPLNKGNDGTAEAKLAELYELINEFGHAAGQSKLDHNVNTHEEYVLLAHNAAEAAKQNADSARSALWDSGRGRDRRGSC